MVSLGIKQSLWELVAIYVHLCMAHAHYHVIISLYSHRIHLQPSSINPFLITQVRTRWHTLGNVSPINGVFKRGARSASTVISRHLCEFVRGTCTLPCDYLPVFTPHPPSISDHTSSAYASQCTACKWCLWATGTARGSCYHCSHHLCPSARGTSPLPCVPSSVSCPRSRSMERKGCRVPLPRRRWSVSSGPGPPRRRRKVCWMGSWPGLTLSGIWTPAGLSCFASISSVGSGTRSSPGKSKMDLKLGHSLVFLLICKRNTCFEISFTG